LPCDSHGSLVEALMDALAPAVLGPVPAYANPRGQPEKPARLLFLAVIWVLAAAVAGIASLIVVGFVIGVHNGMTSKAPGHAWKVAPTVLVLISIIVTDVVLLVAARRRARVVGQGNAIAGLGGGPIRRPRLLAAIAIVGAASVTGWMVLLSQWLKPADNTGITALLKDTWTGGPFLQAATVLCMVGLSPLWEELFFRGWLWTGLRRHWRPLPVMVATALPWLMLHMADGLLRPLFLIPAAIMFSLARQYCGGVRASLTLHVLNNLMAIAIVALALPAGHT
jgi:membrane protease YdiL (CAAX protease family)